MLRLIRGLRFDLFGLESEEAPELADLAALPGASFTVAVSSVGIQLVEMMVGHGESTSSVDMSNS